MPAASVQGLGYLPVATAALTPSAVLSCDLFIQRTHEELPQLYRGKSYPLFDADLEHLRSEGVDHLYIQLSDADAYRAYLCDNVLHDPEKPVSTRMKALREATRVMFQDALTARDCGDLITVARGFGQELATLVSENSSAFTELFKTLEHDYYTFTHVCNVSLYCALIARGLGMTSSTELAEITAAGLLHDIGKRHIPLTILNKTEKLTDEEWAQICEHPGNGFRELATRGDLSWAQLMVVYQHHERMDGSGYPTGVSGDEIHPWARICAVADVFDALTCNRPYRKAMPLSQVCDHLRKNTPSGFDAAAVDFWVSQMQGEP